MRDSQSNNSPSSSQRTSRFSAVRPFLLPLAMLIGLVILGRVGGHYWQTIQSQVVAMGTSGMVLYWVVLVLLPVAFFPVSALGFSAGLLYGWWPGLALIFSGGLVSGLVMYWLGVGLLRSRVREYVKGRPRLVRLDHLAKTRALKLNVLTRFAPLNYGIASYVLAAGRPSLRHYSLGLLAILPSTLVWVWLGELAGGLAAGKDSEHHTPWWLLGAGLVFFAVLLWQVGRMVQQGLALDGAPDEDDADGTGRVPESGFWQMGGEGADVVRATKSAWEWDLAKGRFKVSREFLNQVGYTAMETTFPQDWVIDRIHPLDVPQVRASVEANLRQRDPGLSVEFRFRCADGHYVWLQVLALAAWDRKGKAYSMLGTLTDVTTRVVVAEERDRLFNLSPDLLSSSDFQGNLQQVNPAWVRVLGWSRDELMTKPLSAFVMPEDMHILEEMLTDLAAGKAIDGLETRWQTRSGGSCWLSWNCFPYEGDQRFFAVIRDISRRKEAEAKVLVYQEQLRELSYQLSLVEDRQRRQLATALHDGLAQLLFAARAQVTLLKYPEKIVNAQAVVREVLDLLDETMAEARSLSFQLFPPALGDVGLEAGLRWLADQFDKRRGLVVTVSGEGQEPDLPQDMRSLLFQCTRELLTNVVKHARVDRAQVVLKFTPREVQLTVRDEGAGTVVLDHQPGHTDSKEEKGFGLFSIRERLHAVGGTMEMVAAPGAGTSVALILPLSEGLSDEVAEIGH